ncbi:MAG: type I-E CRISPR-associated protein Cas5/CasD [Spirochaetales bacterium]|uniref:Type I-E CRISPR-associated protein Cas5/CasD n=1 Tax=Candidatus Thalassospirochaeta sargassi TaxID=3119039 RepID=A0AAJ1ML85_9SPIO|nr:type I-E CRISPR-associated protein Cas5/CasD [Spirochaetales bacterium]
MKYLIIKLKGPMQAWGTHTYEGYRPSQSFPTYSGIIGLLAACMGIKRSDTKRLQELSNGLKIAIRVDSVIRDDNRKCRMHKMTDFHTVKDARVSYTGLKSHETIITKREYLYDSEFTVAVWKLNNEIISLKDIEEAVKKPKFTPFLGRRSCPIVRPLFEKIVESDDEISVFSHCGQAEGVIYSETKSSGIAMKVRDVPIWEQKRQFASRLIYAHGGQNVSY